MEKTVNVCCKCSSPISCINIIEGEPLKMCNPTCCLYESCNIRKNLEGYSDVYTISEGGYCDLCWQRTAEREYYESLASGDR